MRSRMLGWFGLVLIVLICWAADQTRPGPRTLTTHARLFIGWLVIESVTAIGWAFDRLAPALTASHTR
jgi:hypothetical protein